MPNSRDLGELVEFNSIKEVEGTIIIELSFHQDDICTEEIAESLRRLIEQSPGPDALRTTTFFHVRVATWWLIGPRRDVERVFGGFLEHFRGAVGHFVELLQYAIIRIRGSNIPQIVAEGSSLDFAVLRRRGYTTARFANIPVLIHYHLSCSSLDFFVERSFRDYLTSWLGGQG